MPSLSMHEMVVIEEKNKGFFAYILFAMINVLAKLLFQYTDIAYKQNMKNSFLFALPKDFIQNYYSFSLCFILYMREFELFLTIIYKF